MRQLESHWDVLLGDVTAATAHTYDRALWELVEFVVERGGGFLAKLVAKRGVVIWATACLRLGYAQRPLGHGAAGQLISAVTARRHADARGPKPAPDVEDPEELGKGGTGGVRPVHRQAALEMAVGGSSVDTSGRPHVPRARTTLVSENMDSHPFAPRQNAQGATRRTAMCDRGKTNAWRGLCWPHSEAIDGRRCQPLLPVWKRSLQLLQAGLRGRGATAVYLNTADAPHL